MGNSYTFTTSGNIQSGSIVRAEDFTTEYTALQSAFDSSSGHSHDGTAGEGGRIETVGPAGQLVVTASALTGSSSKLLNLGTSSNLLLDVFIADDKKIQFGDAQDATIEYDEDGTDTLLFAGANIRIANTNNALEFRDADLKIHSSANGQLDIDADTELEIVAPTVDIQASTAITLASDAVTFGENGDTDIVLSFNANTSDGTLTWMEDEAHFKFSDDIVVDSTKKIYFNDEGGEHISGDATDLTITSGNDLNLTAATDINIPADVGLTFGNDAEKIEGDGTDLTISGNNINLTAVADVNIPTDVGLTFATTEKIESDGTDLTITVGSGGDINIPANIGMTFGNDGEKIEGDGTDLTITGNNINLTATADVVIPADVGITFGSGEKIEGDSTDLTVTSGNDINLTATGTVNLNTDAIGLHFGVNEDVTLTHVHDTGLLLNSTNELQFGSSSTKVHQSSSGVLDLTATTVRVSNDLHLNTDSSVLGFGVHNDITVTHVADTGLNITSVNTDANAGPVLVLDRNNDNASNNDIIGSVQFKGDNASNASVIMGEIKTKITDTTAGNEDSDVIISNMVAGTATPQLTISSTGVTANVSFTNSGDLTVGDDLLLNTDSAVISLGAGADATITHDGTTGVTIAANPITIDSGDALNLDAHTGIFVFKDAGSEVLRFTEGNSGDVTIKLATNGKDLVFTDHGDATNMKILDAAAGINVPGEVQTTKIAFTDGDDAITIADGGGITLAAGLDCGENNITNVGSIALDSISSDAGNGTAIVFNQGNVPNTNTNTSVSGDTAPDFSQYTNFIWTLTGNLVLTDPGDEVAGQSGIFVFIQDGTGNRTLSHADDRYFVAGATSITLSTAASAIDIVPYFVQADGKIHLGAAQLAFQEA